MATWHLYMLRTVSGDLYTGIATDVARRFQEHSDGRGKGAKCLRGKGPLELVLQVQLGSRSLASRAEYALKQVGKARKEALVARGANAASLLDALGLIPDAMEPTP